ncbi:MULTISPECIES: enoyl-CoA hydratase-related protein [unclassified Chelatococcus]|uniref:enoyl-CoA hydratase-related protein n=1 Tax=unclassified Chelatococcus TaxID=2638111 RepID=UPI001BD074DE|nr:MULTISPECIES: enoyl-CoA hydratase-related protein [unclassified Chelatococcus]MBS7742689.1 enoyl-CoA hydratase/isomerase family protein [Chelatococcus sp. HY11]MBX3542193.1 enoyl-CoA hydratase/isomerase family protein [Chelatococcus sp.]MCO5075590.1 enoyl-CoA hydratase-related protein [Chelatococcus sp.]CAH1695282.1 Enoyl-CoA hydratase/carnithine racemase [Hyphomicrobiales bacterium]
MTVKAPPQLDHFRFEMAKPAIGHLVFDTPGRTVNVLSAAALADLERIAAWLPESGLAGLVLSSAKASGFCAGADLAEFEAIRGMVAATAPDDRFAALHARFAPFTRAFRRLETAGVPIAVAIEGPALGGGCELALAGHWRVMADGGAATLGLPEITVGLFPAGGGTQRLPRLIGLDAAVPMLFDGTWLSAEAAVAAGAADALAAPGKTVAEAVAWLESGPDWLPRWDCPGGVPAPSPARLAAFRQEREAEAQGHYPAVTAILDCLERGLSVPMDRANAVEIEALSRLLLRPEPWAMVATLFHGRQAFQRAAKHNGLPSWLAPLVEDVGRALAFEADSMGRALAEPAAVHAGFTKPLPSLRDGVGRVPRPTLVPPPSFTPPTSAQATGLWIDAPSAGWQVRAARLLSRAVLAAEAHGAGLAEADRQMADYAVVAELGFPAYLGGPFALASMAGGGWARAQLNE